MQFKQQTSWSQQHFSFGSVLSDGKNMTTSACNEPSMGPSWWREMSGLLLTEFWQAHTEWLPGVPLHEHSVSPEQYI